MQPALAAKVPPSARIYSTSTNPIESEALVCGMPQPFSVTNMQTCATIYQFISLPCDSETHPASRKLVA